MRTATAWSRSSGVLLGAAVAIGLLVQACEDSSKVSGGNGPGAGADGCVVGPSTSPATAVALTPGQKQSGSICPQGDHDWFAFDVPAGQTLLDVSASYPGSVTSVKLFARLYAADGTTPIANGEIDDASPQTGSTSLQTTLHVPNPGHYLLEIGDIQDAHSDPRNTFVLQVGLAADPDTHEPNDTVALAKPQDAAPGFIAYRGDVDVFKTTVPDTSSLLHVTLSNPAAAKAELDYQITTADGTVVAQGIAPPAALPLDTLRALGQQTDYFIALSYPATAQPDRSPGAGYTLTLGTVPEPDANEKPVRNDTAATATCPGGGTGPCTTTFSGAKMVLPVETGYVASLGDHDVYRVDVTSGAPAVLEADLVAGSTQMQFAIDLLTPHAASPCTKDSECAAINVPCKSDNDCELSHKCLNDDNYTFCTTPPCRLCEGAGVCVPSGAPGGPTVCAADQFSVWDKDGGTVLDTTGKNRVSTAQPLFGPGPYYVVVHDFQDKRFDIATPYTLALSVVPEPDPNDQNADPKKRNNFYNPYPLQTNDLTPNKARAIDITAAMTAKTAITGTLSYQADEDWYQFAHPCPGQDCQLVFEWTQPGPTPVRPAFIVRKADMTIHESWTYTGATAPAQLSGPVTATFGAGDCHECSFAAKAYTGIYYLQVRDVGEQHWDYSSGGQYSFRLSSQVTGCPTQCSEWSGGCGCFCKSLNMCPASPAL